MNHQPEITAFLGLGGNLGEPLAAFRRTRSRLVATPGIGECRSSALYRTPALGGPPGQPDYLNAALMLRTSLTPRDLLCCCQQLEKDAGRQRDVPWGPRTLDIDLLFYADWQISEPDLVVPHPHLTERHFVLLPLVDLDPDWRHPVAGLKMQELLERLPPAENIRLLKRDW